uniref:Uncharacterized protein n=1 Tax=Lepeophtheirus salmonis TaxID=72036 RepID=A0A0K2TEW4_LEPSM
MIYSDNIRILFL